MPTKPKIKKMTATSADVLNAIRNSASINYRDYVPVATQDADSVREIGNVIMQFPALQNEFITNLINRIGRVIVTSKMYTNPLEMFKKGRLDFGESVEELFVNLSKPYEYSAEKAETNVFKRNIPDVRAAFHVMNYQKFYKNTIQQEQLRQAFLSWDGVDDLIAKITDSMYSAASTDEFIMMKYLLAKKILNGQLYPVEVSAEKTTEALKANTSAMRATSNKLTFNSDKYNLAGVTTHTDRADQYILVNADYDALMDVEVLASAFNMTKAEFLGQRILVDGFGTFDTDRLNSLFTDQDGNYLSNYTPLTEAEITALNSIPAVLVDRDFFMIFENLTQFTEQYNGEGLYWQYFYHIWETFSSSPFANAVVFTPTAPTVTGVTVSPATAESRAGQHVQFTAEVVTTGFAPQSVNWTVEGTGATVSSSGLVTLDDTATGEITVTATSTFDSSQTATATITVQV